MTDFTVIIPVYKTEATLDRCVRSVLDLPDAEILLIDDGSPDGCPGLCDGWAEKDRRVRVIHQENRGLGMARNTGIREAKGEFLCFLDSDDTLDVATLPDALALARETGADMVLYGMTCLDSAGALRQTRIPAPETPLYTGEEVTERLLPDLLSGRRGLTASACCALFRTELLLRVNWQFPSEREIISEDIYALLDLLGHVRRAAVLEAAPYRYYENTASLSRSYRPDRYERNHRFYAACLDLCRSRGYGPAVIKSCAEPYLSNIIAAMKQEAAVLGPGAIPGLRALLSDGTLQRALRDAPEGCGWKRALLFACMKRRWVLLLYILLSLQNRTQ